MRAWWVAASLAASAAVTSACVTPQRHVDRPALASDESPPAIAPSVGTVTGVAVLCPGCGHFVLGRPGRATAYLGTTAALLASGLALARDDGAGRDEAAHPRARPVGRLLVTGGQNLWFYSIFDAYRAARIAGGEAGYAFAISREPLAALASAPFRPRVLASPWVWGGVSLTLGAGLLVSYLADRDAFRGGRSLFGVRDLNFLGERVSRGAGFALGEAYYGALFEPVAIGEEALFRGLVQTELEERLGTIGGLAASAALFGAVHVANFDDLRTAAIAIPFLSLVGATLGAAYVHTGHRLETSVAMHFWYDFLLSTTAFVIDPGNQPFVVSYGSAL